MRLLETYESAQSEWPSTLSLPFQSPLQFTRSVLVSYLDEELLVVRDTAGRPDVYAAARPDAFAPATADCALWPVAAKRRYTRSSASRAARTRAFHSV